MMAPPDATTIRSSIAHHRARVRVLRQVTMEDPVRSGAGLLADRIESTVLDSLCEALVCLMIIERFERELPNAGPLLQPTMNWLVEMVERTEPWLWEVDCDDEISSGSSSVADEFAAEISQQVEQLSAEVERVVMS